MISSFSDAGYFILGRPIPDHACFEQAVLKGEFGDNFFQIAGFTAQTFTSGDVA